MIVIHIQDINMKNIQTKEAHTRQNDKKKIIKRNVEQMLMFTCLMSEKSYIFIKIGFSRVKETENDIK